ncbi:hypothetical protein ABIE09_001301 [Lysobacter enzymogenes]
MADDDALQDEDAVVECGIPHFPSFRRKPEPILILRWIFPDTRNVGAKSKWVPAFAGMTGFWGAGAAQRCASNSRIIASVCS